MIEFLWTKSRRRNKGKKDSKAIGKNAENSAAMREGYP